MHLAHNCTAQYLLPELAWLLVGDVRAPYVHPPQDSLKPTFSDVFFCALSEKRCCQKQSPGEHGQNGHFQDGRRKFFILMNFHILASFFYKLDDFNEIKCYLYVFGNEQSDSGKIKTVPDRLHT